MLYPQLLQIASIFFLKNSALGEFFNSEIVFTACD